ncbi:unnamed protein product [Ceratitis capitata]|uniref:(Mediterranean fruit fly) hypothetical protein n=1 Tax=Ceratitis capitata TaxID=7213 RepID=A0A811UTY4_CERCA|nr:unnamed protein product [Ceratitis capitata]
MKNEGSDKFLNMVENELVDSFDETRQRNQEEAKKQIQQAQNIYKKNYNRKQNAVLFLELMDSDDIEIVKLFCEHPEEESFQGKTQIMKVTRERGSKRASMYILVKPSASKEINDKHDII